MIGQTISRTNNFHAKQKMSYSKVNNAIATAVHEEKLDLIKQLKLFLENKMDDVDDINDYIDEFSATLTLTKVKESKKPVADKPKRTRKATFYNHWLGIRLKEFGEEQNLLPEDERVPRTERMKHVSLEWKALKEDTDAFNVAKAKWEESSSETEEPKKRKEEPKKQKKRAKKSKVVPKKVEESDNSDSDSDNEGTPVAINSDSEDENDE